MKLSTKGRYGLRALIDLAIHTENGMQESLPRIAERQKISEIYMEQVFSVLRKNGIVQSVKGPQGGYFLAKPPEEISVGMILKALEGDLSVMDEREKSNQDPKSLTHCIKVNVWEQIDQKIEDLVSQRTLKDLVELYKSKNDQDVIMFYI